MVFSSVYQVFSMMASADKHLEHLNTSFRETVVVGWIVEMAGVVRKENNSAPSGVQGVFPQVDVINTANTSYLVPAMVFGGDAA